MMSGPEQANPQSCVARQVVLKLPACIFYWPSICTERVRWSSVATD